MKPGVIREQIEPCTEIVRHWCPQSETYTGADSLLTALAEGWQMGPRVMRHDVRIGSSQVRFTSVSYFELRRDGRTVTMPVLATPMITRIIVKLDLSVLTAVLGEPSPLERVKPLGEQPGIERLA